MFSEPMSETWKELDWRGETGANRTHVTKITEMIASVGCVCSRLATQNESKAIISLVL